MNNDNTLSSAYFIPREQDKNHQLFKRVRMMPLYSFPCLKYYNLSKKEHEKKFFIHFDLDCFYPQVETRDNPKLKGKPVGVISVSDSRYKGIVMSSNYEARALGVDTAMSVYQAITICPEIILVNCYGQKYESILNHIKQLIYNYVPEEFLEQYSIDECFVDLTSVCKSWGQALKLSLEIKEQIWKEERLTTSIGLSYNKTYAKIATKLQKPNGLTMVKHADKFKMIYPLKADKIWGIGTRIYRRLNFLGIKTIEQLANSDEYRLRKEFGINGICYHRMANGYDTTDIFRKTEHEKMLMTQHSRDNATSDEAEIEREVHRSCEYVCRKMRAKKLVAKKLMLVIRYDNLTYDVEQSDMPQHTNDDRLVVNSALKFYKKFHKPEQLMVKLVGTAVYDLREDLNRTNFELFEEIRQMPFYAIDKIKMKYGESVLRIGLNQ